MGGVQRSSTRMHDWKESWYFRPVMFRWLLPLCAMLSLDVAPVMGQLTWQRTYGGYSIDEGNCVVAGPNGNLLVVGSTGSFGAGNGDIYVLLLDSTGSKIWSTTVGGTGVDQGKKAVLASDGGYVIVGVTNSFGYGGYDGYVAKIDSVGTLVWERSYGGDGWDFFNSITPAQDGGYVVAGETYSSGSGGGDGWLVKLDVDGEMEWEHTFGGAQHDLFNCVARTTDDGYVLAGGHTTDNDMDAWVVKVDQSGEQAWESLQGGDSVDVANAIIQTIEGGYVAVGSTRSYGSLVEALQFRVNALGVVVWVQHWLQGSGEEYYDLVEMPDGRLVSVGYVDGLGSGGKDMYILFSGSDGGFISGITNGGDQGTEDEVAKALVRFGSSGFVICGYTESFGFGSRDVYLVRTDSAGVTSSTMVQVEFDPLGIADVLKTQRISAYPNVVMPNGIVHLDGLGEGVVSVSLLDIQGKAIESLDLLPGSTPAVRIPNFAPGPYLLSVQQVDQLPITVRLIVMN